MEDVHTEGSMRAQAPNGVAAQRARLRSIINGNDLTICPGVVHALDARLAEFAGFEMVYATGAGIANTALGVPDIGLLSMNEVLETIRRIANAITIPLLADIDTGYGSAMNVFRAVAAFSAAGVAGIQIEDQTNPKRCGHFTGKQVVHRAEMAERIIAAVEARGESDVVIVARTDAIATHGVAEAVSRAELYLRSGADMIFVEAPQDRQTLVQIAREVDAPLLVNLVEGGLTPLIPASDLAAMGYRIALYANSAMRLAARAVQDGFRVLRATGSTEKLLDRMITWDERCQLTDLDGWITWGEQVAERAAKVVASDS